MFRDGRFVSEHVDPTTDDQVQPNGVDLTLEAAFEPVESGQIGRDGTEIGERDSIAAAHREGADASESGPQPDAFFLPPGGYVVRYGEVVSIPDRHVGFLYPRSSLLRNGCMLNTAVWDAGYEGKGEGLLQVHNEIEIERGARIAQLVLARADHEGTYDGSYQGENV